jgi:hypothetical protein
MDKHLVLQLFHIFFVGPLFLYVAILRTKIPEFMYPFLFGLGIFIILYHSYKTYIKLNNEENPWINLFHIFIVAPVLIYIGYNREKTGRPAFEMLLMLAFSVIGYHSYYLFNS